MVTEKTDRVIQEPTAESDDFLLRLHHIIGKPKADPPIPAMVPVSKSTLYRWISNGLFPAPVKPTPTTSFWSNNAAKSAIKSWEQSNG